MKEQIKSIFIAGLKALLPIGLTITLVVWILKALEAFFGFLVKLVLPNQYYFDGLGLIVGLLFVFLVGAAMNAWIARKVYSWGEAVVRRIPLVKSLYGAIMDLMQFFDKDKMKEAGQVVMVSVAGTRMLGLLTRDSFEDLPAGLGREGEVSVFIPLAYQIGGITVWVPRDQVEKLDMSVDWAMRFAITAGMIHGK